MGTEEASIKTGDTQIFEEGPVSVGFQEREQSQGAGVASGSSILQLCSDDLLGLCERWVHRGHSTHRVWRGA